MLKELAIFSSATTRHPLVRSSDAGWYSPRVLTIFVVIFICGIAAGSAATRAFLHSRMAPSPLRAPVVGVDLLKQELHLTPDQEKVVMQSLDDYAKYYDNIEEERQSVAEHGKLQILSVLNPDQQKRFLQLFSTKPLPQAAP